MAPSSENPPLSLEQGALGVSPVWAASILLLELGQDWCQLAGAKGCPPARLSARIGCDCLQCAGGWGSPPVSLADRLVAATVAGARCATRASLHWSGVSGASKVDGRCWNWLPPVLAWLGAKEVKKK